MKKILAFILLFFAISHNGMAASWQQLNQNNTSKLSVDKQSILEKNNLKRAWVKIEFKSPQKNTEFPDKEYDLSKLLWYFDCGAQKSATSQVFQYLNSQLVYSAGVDIKNAEFIEPVPETDFDVAMRYVCKPPAQIKPKPAQNPEDTSDKPKENAEKIAEQPTEANVQASKKAEITPEKEKNSKAKSASHEIHWTYEGKEGPKNWGKLKPEFATCDTGRNQSPINIDGAVDAPLSPLKIRAYSPANDIVNNGHTVQANFKLGNSLVLDDTTFKMIQVHFHSPSENTINGASYPLEAHFVHADTDGNLAVIGVMFKVGKANIGLTKLWEQLPSTVGKPTKLKSRVLASQMMPTNRDYYRFSGSLTTPPCSEGVRWLLMKTPITASKDQISAFEKAIHHRNNRPVQALNGRIIVE